MNSTNPISPSFYQRIRKRYLVNLDIYIYIYIYQPSTKTHLYPPGQHLGNINPGKQQFSLYNGFSLFPVLIMVLKARHQHSLSFQQRIFTGTNISLSHTLKLTLMRSFCFISVGIITARIGYHSFNLESHDSAEILNMKLHDSAEDEQQLLLVVKQNSGS